MFTKIIRVIWRGEIGEYILQSTSAEVSTVINSNFDHPRKNQNTKDN